MLLVRASPVIVTAGTLTVTARVLFHAGRRLVVMVDDDYRRVCKLPDDMQPYYPITSNDFVKTTTFTFTQAEVSTDRLVKLRVEVTDADGNVYERAIVLMVVASTVVSVQLPQISDILYVSNDGAVINVRSSVAYVNTMTTTIVRMPGRLIVYDKLSKIADISGESAVVTFRISVPLELAKLYTSYVSDPRVTSIVVDKAPELSYWLGAVAYIERVVKDMRMTVISLYPEKRDTSIDITVAVNVDLRSNFDWDQVVRWLVIAGSIVAAGLIVYGTAGLGAPLAIKVALGGISLATVSYLTYSYVTADKPTQILSVADKAISEAESKLLQYRGSLEDFLNQLVAQGKITLDDKSKIMEYVDNIVRTSVETFKNLRDMIKKAYEEGYSKAKSEYAWWIIGAGIGGFVLCEALR